MSENEILLNTAGPTMPTIVDYDYRYEESENIHFNGESFIEMDTLKAHSKVKIKLEIITFTTDGIILYNGQTNTGEGDYIALILKNSFIISQKVQTFSEWSVQTLTIFLIFLFRPYTLD